MDAEYYKANFLEVEERLKNANSVFLDSVSKSIKSFGAYALCNQMVLVDKGIPFIRCKNIKEGFVDFSEVLFINKTTHRLLSKSAVVPNTVMLTMSGTVGNSAIADPEWLYPINSNQDIAKIEATEKINPYYLTVFLNTRYGKNQTKRLPIGSIQQHIFIWQLKRLLIFCPVQAFQKTIQRFYKEAIDLLKSSKNYYTQAQNILLSELGLLDWKPKKYKSYIKNFSDTQKSNRMDAEYFDPNYEDVENKLNKFEQKTLKELCSLLNYGTVPTSPYIKKGTPYIKGLNLIDGFIGGSLDCLENTESLPKKFYTKENDIIISQMGTVGKAGIVEKNEENYLFASFTIRARMRDYSFIDPCVLTLFINVVARPYYLLRRIAQASVRQNTDLPTVKELKVPKLDLQLQQKIGSNIIESKKTKKQSKSLLEIAKKGVEMAIEKNESEAENWINAEIEKLGISITDDK